MARVAFSERLPSFRKPRAQRCSHDWSRSGSYGEIAVRLRCSEQVVRQRVHRGLKQLRANLEEEA